MNHLQLVWQVMYTMDYSAMDLLLINISNIMLTHFNNELF